MPSLAFIYWPAEISTAHATQIRIATLAGVVLGALVLGHLADRVGRRKVQGFGFIITLISTIGTTQASAGFNNATMSFLGWLLFWRSVLGIGIGALYVSAAVVTAE